MKVHNKEMLAFFLCFSFNYFDFFFCQTIELINETVDLGRYSSSDNLNSIS